MRNLAMVGAAALFCVMATTALAGTVITLKTTGGPDGQETNTISLEPDRVRMNSAHGEIIYRADLHKVWMIDNGDRTYREITPESMQQMRSMMAGALAQMPPEQRQRIEAMMAQRGMGPPGAGAAQPRQATWTQTGGSKTVGQWSCTPYKMSVNGVAEGDMCIARLADVGLTRDDFKAFISFGSFMQQGMPGPAGQRPAGLFDFDAMSKSIGFDGVPVETTRTAPDGGNEVVGTLQSVEHESIPADAFELPVGYTKQEMPMMGPGRMPSGARPPAE